MGNTTRQGMKFGLILLLLLAGVVLGIRMLLSREGGRPRYTDMPQLLALCGSKNAPAVKEALLHSDEGALRNEETTLLHVLLERDADPAVLREALSPPSPLLRMVQLTDAQGRTPLHIAAARANPAALLLLHCMDARDTTPDREGRLALDIIQELGADEMAARLPFWENRGKQEGRMVVNLQQSKTVQIRGRKYRLEAKGFLSYASLATNEGELAYVAAVQGAAASLPEDERYNIQNNDTDLPYIPDHIGLSPLPGDSGRVSPWYWRNGGFRDAESGRRAALLKCLWPKASPLMLRVLTDPGFRADPAKLAGVLLAEWSAWNIPGDVLGPALLEGNENLRKRPPGTTIWFSPSGLSSYPWYHRNSTPMFSVWLLLAALRDDVALPREVREAAPALADLCDIRAALGRERWRKAGRHLCAAAWLEEQTPTDKLLEKAVDDWNSPTDMKLIIQAWSGGGRIVPKGLWRKPDAIRCWAARRTEAGPDAGEPLVCVASTLGHVDEATGKRMIRMMLASGAKPDVPDGNGMFPEEAARRSGASAELLKLLAAPPPEWTQGTDGAPQRDKQAPPSP